MVKRWTFDGTLAGVRPWARGNGWALLRGDSLEILRRLLPGSIDLVATDPPYNLSNGGTTCSSGKRVAVSKGKWDESAGVAADYAWHSKWIHLCRHLLAPHGTIWCTGTHHVAHLIGFVLQYQGWHLLNTVTWFKPNAPPNLGCRTLTHSTELALWAAPHGDGRHVFSYQQLREQNGGKQLRDMWEGGAPGAAEKRLGKHPTQKPLWLLERMILAASASEPPAVVLDPFCGSGTSGVAALQLGRSWIGIDNDTASLKLAQSRLAAGG